MRISDWSSDVCSSDLSAGNLTALGAIPDNVPEVEVVLEEGNEIHVVPLLRLAGLAQNGKAAKDVFARGAVYVNGEQITEDRAFARGEIGRASCRERVCQYG